MTAVVAEDGTTPSPSPSPLPRPWLRPYSPVSPRRPMIRLKYPWRRQTRRSRRRGRRILPLLPPPSFVDYGTSYRTFSGNGVGKCSPNAANGCTRSSRGGAIISISHKHKHKHNPMSMMPIENRFLMNNRRCIGERT